MRGKVKYESGNIGNSTYSRVVGNQEPALDLRTMAEQLHFPFTCAHIISACCPIGCPSSASLPPYFEGVFSYHHYKQYQAKYLEAQSGDQDMCPTIHTIFCWCCIRKCSTNRLQDKRDPVGSHESDRDGLGAKSGQVRTIVEKDPRVSHVYLCREEDWRDCYAYQISAQRFSKIGPAKVWRNLH